MTQVSDEIRELSAAHHEWTARVAWRGAVRRRADRRPSCSPPAPRASTTRTRYYVYVRNIPASNQFNSRRRATPWTLERHKKAGISSANYDVMIPASWAFGEPSTTSCFPHPTSPTTLRSGISLLSCLLFWNFILKWQRSLRESFRNFWRLWFT